MVVAKAGLGISADQGSIAGDLSSEGAERVGAWIGAGGDDHLSPLRASAQATLAVKGGRGGTALTAKSAHLALDFHILK